MTTKKMANLNDIKITLTLEEVKLLKDIVKGNIDEHKLVLNYKKMKKESKESYEYFEYKLLEGIFKKLK